MTEKKRIQQAHLATNERHTYCFIYTDKQNQLREWRVETIKSEANEVKEKMGGERERERERERTSCVVGVSLLVLRI